MAPFVCAAHTTATKIKSPKSNRQLQQNVTMSALPSSKKTHSERHKQILKLLLKEPANKTCVDCKTATHPRWALWNLGCFMCIRCSGIHRSMGTHISRVKLVDLDAWTDEQVELMVKWGNEKCNGYWEAKLPEGYVPDASKIENFIRTKYDLKKWALLPTRPDPMTVSGKDKVPEKPVTTAPTPVASRPTASSQKPAANNISIDVLGLDDDFGSFTSSALPTPPAAQAAPAPVQANVARVPERRDLKKSILSLYSSPASSSSSFGNSSYQSPPAQSYSLSPYNLIPTQTSYNQTSHNQTVQPVSQNNSSKHTLNGSLSFDTEQSTASSIANVTGTMLNLLVTTKSWDDEWSSEKPAATTTTSYKLDDDLFKNVWS